MAFEKNVVKRDVHMIFEPRLFFRIVTTPKSGNKYFSTPFHNQFPNLIRCFGSRNEESCMDLPIKSYI